MGWVTIGMIQTCGSLESKVAGIFGSGVCRVDGECVGVTDGSFIFDPVFVDVQEKIATENAKVRAESHPCVTVALLDLLTPTVTSATSVEGIRSELEDAYTAQLRINESVRPADSHSRIRLVLANQGSTLEQWGPVAAQLTAMTQEGRPVVAVIGLGISVKKTQKRATRPPSGSA